MELDRVAFGEEGRGAERVLQLADVTRPGVARQCLERRRSEPERRRTAYQ